MKIQPSLTKKAFFSQNFQQFIYQIIVANQVNDILEKPILKMAFRQRIINDVTGLNLHSRNREEKGNAFLSMRFVPLFSGSSGNCLFLQDQAGGLLVDCGMPLRTVQYALECIGADAKKLAAVLVTHAHGDHVRGVGALARRLKLPVYATAATMQEMQGFCGPLPQTVILESNKPFCVADFEVLPFSLPHDTSCTVGYRFDSASGSAAVATDLGHMPLDVLSALSGCQTVLLEFNHDPMMLKNGKYPAFLKQRILGKRGHLSNQDASDALCVLGEKGCKSAFLGHISRENNTPLLALETAKQALLSCGAQEGDMRLMPAYPDRPTLMGEHK